MAQAPIGANVYNHLYMKLILKVYMHYYYSIPCSAFNFSSVSAPWYQRVASSVPSS